MHRLHGAVASGSGRNAVGQGVGDVGEIFSKEISEISEISAETNYIGCMTDRDQTYPIGWWRLCGRPLVAYCVASVAAGVTLGLIEVPFTSGLRLDRGLTAGLMFGLFLSPFVIVLALVPSVIALAIAKTMQLRRGLADAIAGGLIGAAMITLLSQSLFGAFRLGEEVILEAARYGIAGLVGGYVYWTVNGRPRTPRRAAARRQPVDLSVFD